jgi:hypothetical protein
MAIHNLTEEQATAWVEGPLSEEMREKCELVILWSEALDALAACIWTPRGRIGVGVGVVGDGDAACRVYAIRKAVTEAASGSGMRTEAVYVPETVVSPDHVAVADRVYDDGRARQREVVQEDVGDVPGPSPDPEALLEAALAYLSRTCAPGRLQHHCIALQCHDCWRDYLTCRVQEKAKCAETEAGNE